MIVLDSNVLSELMRTVPAEAVVTWVRDQEPAALSTTAVSVAEILYGIERLPGGRRRTRLRHEADLVFASFRGVVLPFDAVAARHYADVVVERERAGRPIGGFDAQIAATCRSHQAALATRNIDDFDDLGLDVVNPWDA